ncbi:MAG: 4Fe-4S dicluster domain-containing protein [Deltaproteobacteria bacterium]|nr:4Fe-4S dicluster domain-containing protein [Deltaproteobacteria bacterium]
MFFQSRRLLRSGYHFGKLHGGDYSGPIERAELPDKVIIPLKQGFSAETLSLVKKGDHVRAGQIIGRDDHSWSSPVHSSINGVVEYFESFMEGHEPHYGVVIRRDHKDERGYVPVPGGGSADKTADEISEILYLAGVTALGSTGIPSFHHTSDLKPDGVKGLVINGLSGEPFSLPQEQLLKERLKDFVTGLKILKKLFQLEGNIHITLGKASALAEEIKKFKISGIVVHTFQNKYPFHMDAIISELTTGNKVPAGGTPSEIGLVVLTIQDVLHVYEALVIGKPLIERTIAIGGPGAEKSRLMKVAVGSPVEWLLLGNIKVGVEERILVGGAMRGAPLESARHPVERTFSALTLLEENREQEFLYFLRPGFDLLSYSREYISSFLRFFTRRAETNMQGEGRACIYCSYCEDVCPRQLVPHLYSRYIRHDMAEEAIKYGLELCIDCGLCTFVCPSKILLGKDIIEGKKSLEERGRWSHPKGLGKLESLETESAP